MVYLDIPYCPEKLKTAFPQLINASGRTNNPRGIGINDSATLLFLEATVI